MSKSYYFSRILRPDQTVSIAHDKVLRVQGGSINHVTGTDSYVDIVDRSGWVWTTLLKIASAVASGGFNFNDRITTNVTTTVDTTKLWIPRGFFLKFSGGAAAYCELIMEEKDA